ncbi:hypothetical protein EG328_002309 [Venturia inaequalis]|uniref:Uncharacterized protein n=1 Tax=Venturia inaequalis TaxID=5025 RepID=A0A8H3UTN8_VENIN|nr:hypothetical protein EG328_002309 [Venturia inaequalis]
MLETLKFQAPPGYGRLSRTVFIPPSFYGRIYRCKEIAVIRPLKVGYRCPPPDSILAVRQMMARAPGHK